MRNKKQQETPVLSNNLLNEFSSIYKTDYLRRMEYIIINYLDNLKALAKYDNSAANNTSEYIKDVVSFIVSYNHSRGFHFNLTFTDMRTIWKSIREQSSNHAYFLLHVTTMFRSGLTTAEYNEIVENVSDAYGLFQIKDKEYGHNVIIQEEDFGVYKQLPTKNLVKELITYNPWVLTLILINQMDAIIN